MRHDSRPGSVRAPAEALLAYIKTKEDGRRSFDEFAAAGEAAHPPARPSMLQLARPRSRWQRAMKRTVDVALGSAMLLLSLPVVAMAATAVKVSDGGPVFYRQSRVGRDGRHFTILKLRTMVVGADRMIIDLRARNQRQGPLFKLARDPRVTPVGRFLRVASIDELPQLLNVLRGHMSLVGPRPALPEEVEWFDDGLHARHDVRPGITGLWQIAARDHPSFTLYRNLDLYYVRNWGIVLDTAVLAVTVQVVVQRLLRAMRRSRPSTVLD